MKHSEGPWSVDHHKDQTYILDSTGRSAIALVVAGRVDGTGPGNAQLIATAPELLEQLKRMCKSYMRLMENGRDRILMLQGDCDPLDKMEAEDVALRDARSVLIRATAETTGGSDD